MSSMPTTSTHSGWWLPALVFLLSLVALFGSQSPPPAKSASADAGEFSAERAFAQLTDLLGDQQPHPLGSEANERVRGRIVSALQRLGLQPEVRARFVCAPYGVCGTPHNIMARIKGQRSDELILLASHYDSVFAGPGAGDAGASVAAIIEIARALLAGPKPERDILLLIDDGEEAGLLGARAFMQEPEAKRVRAVINMEARGTKGLSRLFETSTGNAEFAKLLKAHLPHPSTSSLYYEIYKLLPNDTDLSVFKAQGLAGVGMAFVEGAERYHTPLDDLAHLDRDTLQDQGDSGLALARAFAAHEGVFTGDHDAVYFDVLGRFVLSWPATWSLFLLIAGLLLTIVAWRRLPAMLRPGFRTVLIGLLIALQLPIYAWGAGWLAMTALQAGDALPATWFANAELAEFCFALIGAGVGLMLRPLAERFAQSDALLIGLLLLHALLAILLVYLLPGAAFVGLLPLLLGGLALCVRRWHHALLASALIATQLLTLGTLALFLYDGLGAHALPLVSSLCVLLTWPLVLCLPETVVRRRSVQFATVIALVVSLLAVWQRPGFDEHSRLAVSLALQQGPDQHRLVVQTELARPNTQARLAVPMPLTQGVALPWQQFRSWIGPVAKNGDDALPAPKLSLLAQEDSADGTRYRLRLESQRQAAIVGFALPATIERKSIRINGVGIIDGAKNHRDGGQTYLAWYIYHPEAEIDVLVPKGQALSGYLFDRNSGLPAAQQAVRSTRDLHALPIGGGDSTLVWAKLELPINTSGAVPGRNSSPLSESTVDGG